MQMADLPSHASSSVMSVTAPEREYKMARNLIAVIDPQADRGLSRLNLVAVCRP